MRSIAKSAQTSPVGVSAISAWEVGKLALKGRIELGCTPAQYFKELFERPDVAELAVSASIGVRAAAISGFHGDPADRILIATAIEHDCPIVTRDRRILAFAERSGTFKALAC
jgi:PIN domain nuclease of toxin-antitoxin system